MCEKLILRRFMVMVGSFACLSPSFYDFVHLSSKERKRDEKSECEMRASVSRCFGTRSSSVNTSKLFAMTSVVIIASCCSREKSSKEEVKTNSEVYSSRYQYRKAQGRSGLPVGTYR